MTQRLVLVSLLAACTTSPSEGDSASLAEVTLASGAVVSFYETSPGAIAVSEAYALGEEPVPTIGRSAVEVFHSIAPGREVPEALVAAQARNLEARASRPHAPSSAPQASYIDNTTIDDKWFADSYCHGSWDLIYCRLDQTAAIGFNNALGSSDTDELYEEGCSDRGQGDMWSLVDGIYHQWTILQGNCRYYHWTSGWLNEKGNGGMFELANNARFHLSVRIRH
jgi:hypothetical protein